MSVRPSELTAPHTIWPLLSTYVEVLSKSISDFFIYDSELLGIWFDRTYVQVNKTRRLSLITERGGRRLVMLVRNEATAWFNTVTPWDVELNSLLSDEIDCALFGLRSAVTVRRFGCHFGPLVYVPMTVWWRLSELNEWLNYGNFRFLLRTHHQNWNPPLKQLPTVPVQNTPTDTLHTHRHTAHPQTHCTPTDTLHTLSIFRATELSPNVICTLGISESSDGPWRNVTHGTQCKWH